MKREDLEPRFKEIGECATIEDARLKIVELQKEISQDYDNHISVLSERDSLKNDNESLRQTNMKLFLQVGDKKEPDKSKTPTDDEDLKYEDLFNEKGGLK